MGISTRELLLVLRARDEVSRVLRQIGGNITGLSEETMTAARKQIAQGAALATVGVGIAAAGAAGIQFFNDAADAAIEYNRATSLTKTQVDKVGVSLETLKNIGRDVAKAIPAPFEQMQTMLYDIFSSMDVSVADSKVLLTEFSKAAVAGQVDLQQAGRATISIMNAWHMPASKVNEVNDKMFQLVRKGVGTYDEFSRSIGRAIPSTVRAGQNFDMLAASMAFLTRNGLSTQQAATSVARAMDALSNPKSVKNMEALGIQVKNAKGEFLPLPQLLDNIAAKMKGMTGPEKGKFITELFKGSGGTIQARRFFDLVFTNMDQFKARVKDMGNSKGVMEEAYKTMFDTPQSKIQLLTNKYQVLKTQIGDVIIPFKMALVDAATRILEAWDKLSPGMQKTIIIVLAVMSALAVLVGILMVVAGLWLMLSGAAVLAGVALSTVFAIIGGVVLAIVAIGLAIFAIIKYHDQLWAAAQRVWSAIKPFIQPIIDILKQLWAQLVNDLKPAWDSLKQAWDQLASSPIVPLLKSLAAVIGIVLVVAILAVIAAFAAVVTFIANVLPPIVNFIAAIINNIVGIFAGLIKFVVGVFSGNWKMAWEGVKQIFSNILGLIGNILKGAVLIIWGILKGLVMGIINFFKFLYNVIVGNSIVPDMIMAIIRWFVLLPIRVLAAIAGLVGAVISWAGRVMHGMHNKFVAGVTRAVTIIRGLKDRIVGAITGMAGSMYNAGSNLMRNLYNGITSWVGSIMGKMGDIANKIRSFLPFSPAKRGPLRRYPMDRAGRNIMMMLAGGMDEGLTYVTSSMNRAANHVANQSFGPPSVPGGGEGGPFGVGGGGYGNYQHIEVHTQEIDPVKHSAELGFELARKRG